MKSNKVFLWIFVCLIFSALLWNAVQSLLWKQFTLMQVVCCVSWPIPYKNPLRKLFFNVGFQFNFAEPFTLSNFYNTTYYNNIFNSRNFDDASSSSCNSTECANASMDPDNAALLESLKDGRVEPRSIGDSNDLVGSDLTAGQLYASIEDNFMEIGYDRSCLKKAICELSRHPLHNEDEEEHLLLDIINLMLTPTKHNGFAEHESYQRQTYEAAQKIGENGHDCDVIYDECDHSILNTFSSLTSS